MVQLANQHVKSTREFAITLLRDEFAEAVNRLPPELQNRTQDELEIDRKPTDIDYFLRKNLWKLVENAQNGLISEIRAPDIYKGVCSKQVFHNVVNTPLRVAWLMTIPHQDQELMEAGLAIGLKNLIKFVSKEPTVETAGAFIKAIEFLTNRVHGPLVQTTRNLNLNVNKNSPAKEPPKTPSDVNARLEELKGKLLEAKDVTPKVDAT